MSDCWTWLVRGLTPPSLMSYIKSLGWQQRPYNKSNFVLLVAPSTDAGGLTLETPLPYPVNLAVPAQRREWHRYAELAIELVAAYLDCDPAAVALAAMPGAVRDQAQATLDLLARVERGEVTDEP